MLNIKFKSNFFVNNNFSHLMKYYVVGAFSFFISFNCLSENKSLASKQVMQGLSKPDCSPRCEKIDMISFNFIDKDKIFSKEQKETLLNGLKNLVAPKRADIKFVSLYNENIDQYYYQPIPVMISAEINFRLDLCDKTSANMDVKIIFPDKFYSKTFICPLENKNSCVSERFKQEVEKNINDYLFKSTGGSIL